MQAASSSLLEIGSGSVVEPLAGLTGLAGLAGLAGILVRSHQSYGES
jgi:hypothetical protein